MPSDVAEVFLGEILDEEECVLVKIAIELAILILFVELHTLDSVMQRKPLNIAIY
jgi:hypothetical protein